MSEARNLAGPRAGYCDKSERICAGDNSLLFSIQLDFVPFFFCSFSRDFSDDFGFLLLALVVLSLGLKVLESAFLTKPLLKFEVLLPFFE
jgi:hypothetical protein